MGRPIHKKYFGNTNTPPVGGEGVASAAVNAAGSYTTRPLITFGNPDVPVASGGVLALGTITSEVLSVSIGGTQTNAYPVAAGAISFAGGTTTSTYTATVTSSALASVGNSANTQISFNTTTTAMLAGTSIHITGSGAGDLTIGGTALATGQIYYVGAPVSATAATLYATYADAIAGTSALAIGGTTVTGFTFTRGVTYGTVTALTPVNRGEFEALVTGAQTAVVNNSTGAGLTITPTYRAKSVVITTAGAGYYTAPTSSVTQSVTLQTITLTSTKANAIKITAFVVGGSSAVAGDIIKQEASRRYLVDTAQGQSQVKLVAAAPAAGEATIIAVDSDTNEYYVTKLTAHRALLTRKAINGSAYEFATGQSVPWKLTAAVLNTSVQVENA